MKKKDTKNSLMPSGIIDLIDDRAANEFYLTQILINNFIKKGYRLVTPPLIAFGAKYITLPHFSEAMEHNFTQKGNYAKQALNYLVITMRKQQ